MPEKKLNIKAFVTDVDGCLTDGAIYMGDNGRFSKFHAHDGMGFSLLRAAGIPYFAISGRVCEGVLKRLEQLKFNGIKLGSQNKLKDLAEMLDEHNIDISEVAFMGDDIIDIECMEKAAISYAPANAVDVIRDISTHPLAKAGGFGAGREAIEDLLSNELEYDTTELYKEHLKEFTQ